jgi:uncharacterized repeat protein (TIGR02543 family)
MTEAERRIARELWKITINGYDFYPEDFSEGTSLFSGFYDFTNLNQKVYQTEPARSDDFAMPGINDIMTAEPPQLKIDYKYMSINTFRRLRQATKPNEFLVDYYDFEYGVRRSMLMYIQPLDMPKFTTWTLDRLAALDLSLTLVATMNDTATISITYNSNGGTGAISPSNGYVGEVANIADDKAGISRQGYSLKEWNTAIDGSGQSYAPGSTTVLTRSMTLYAQWNASGVYTMFFAYGQAPPPDDAATNPNWIPSKAVTLNQAVGELPAPTWDGYTFGGWWNAQNTQQFTAATVYAVQGNQSVYAKWTKNTEN